MDLQTFFITTTCVIGICIIVIIMQKYLINNTNNIKKIIEKQFPDAFKPKTAAKKIKAK